MILQLALVTLSLFEGQDLTKYTKLAAPGVEYKMNVASATRAPWIQSNVWRIRRNPARQFWAEIPEGSVVLAMAEAHAYGANVVFKAPPSARAEYDRVTSFLKGIEQPNLKPLANFAVEDDGSAAAGEALNLLARRNLLYRIGKPSDGEIPLKVTSAIKNPHDFAQEVRSRLGDDKRLLRIYGSEVVLGNLTGNGKRLRVHLINYGRRPLEGIRVRVVGNYKVERVASYQAPGVKAEDIVNDSRATEFSVSNLPVYAVIDLVQQ